MCIRDSTHTHASETYHNVEVGIDVIKEELVEYVRTRTDVALQLVTCALCSKVRQHKECHRGETKIVGVDVNHPTVSVWSNSEKLVTHKFYCTKQIIMRNIRKGPLIYEHL